MKDLSYFRRIFFDLGTVKTLGAFRNLLRRWVWDCWPSQFISSGWIFPTPINFKSYTEKKVNIFLKLYILEKPGLSTVGLGSETYSAELPIQGGVKFSSVGFLPPLHTEIFDQFRLICKKQEILGKINESCWEFPIGGWRVSGQVAKIELLKCVLWLLQQTDSWDSTYS